MIKAIIFDADGVLIHREKYFSERLRDEFNIPLEKSLIFFNGEFAECLIGKKDLKKVLPKYLKEWGYKDSLEKLLQFWFESESKLDQNLITYINKLKAKNIKILVGTNNEIYRTNYLSKKTELGVLADKIYGSGHIGKIKPEYSFYAHILKEIKVKKEEVLFWDDDLENVDAAKEFGIHAELYTNFLDFKEKMMTYLAL